MAGTLYRPLGNLMNRLFHVPTAGSYGDEHRSNTSDYWNRRVSRRALLGGAFYTGLGITAALVVGCGDGDSKKQTKLGDSKAGLVRIESDNTTGTALRLYDHWLESDVAYVAQFLNIDLDPKNPIELNSSDGNYFIISYNGYPGGSPIKAKVHKDKLVAANRIPMLEALTQVILPTPVAWYNQGLALVVSNGESFKYRRDPHNRLLFHYDDILRSRQPESVQSGVKGEVFFRALRRDYGWDPKNDTVPRELHERLKANEPITSRLIFDLYAVALSRDLDELEKRISLLESANIDTQPLTIGR